MEEGEERRWITIHIISFFLHNDIIYIFSRVLHFFCPIKSNKVCTFIFYMLGGQAFFDSRSDSPRNTVVSQSNGFFKIYGANNENLFLAKHLLGISSWKRMLLEIWLFSRYCLKCSLWIANICEFQLEIFLKFQGSRM